MSESNERIESEFEVNSYLSKLRYILDNGAKVQFQIKRNVDLKRDEKYTNRYTVNELFPNENPETALRRELRTLTVENYIKTVKDLRFPKRSEMREFGKVYDGSGDIYIKIRVEAISADNFGKDTAYVMSFHFAEREFSDGMFPYKK